MAFTPDRAILKLVAELPSGTVTFLFSDVEGSTRLAYDQGERFPELLVEHRRVLRDVFARHGGIELETEGDAFFIVFASAREAVAAAAEAQAALKGSELNVRIGLHTGEARLVEGTYLGLDVHRAARIATAGHGGQVLLSQSTRSLIDGELKDLGEHRLKDLRAAEHLYQVGGQEFPPLKSLGRTTLPIPPTPFLGRERELGEVTALLARDSVRLLTLTGPGGTGKTRLAIQAAAELAEHYPDGVFWVGLASLRDPQLVLPTIAQALGAKRALHEHIGGKRLLLLLDSLEHLIAGAPEFTQLLAACPQLNLLCTSREPLHLSGEQEYPVPTLTEADAVSLFAARAFAIKPDFSANGEIAEICRRLDQLPLAIELAAARVKVLSPAAILARLEQRLSLLTGGAHDLPERQRTLRAAIEWSYDLLSAEEQRLFARLAVFAGGCTLEAAEEICDADLDTLQSLVDKSLIRHSGERYWMLETIREFAAERLIESGDAKDWRLRHADFFVRLAEQAEPEFMGAQQLTWLQLLDAEHDNFRTAIDFLRQIGDVTRELKLIGSHWRFWYLRGFLTEGRRRVESALTVGGEQPSVLREKVLYGALVLAHRQGDYERAEAFATERLALAERLGDTKRLASSLLGFGLIADVRGDYDLAVTSTRRGAELARETGDKAILAMALNNLGDFAKLQGEYEQAKLYFEEALAIFRELPDTHGIAAALTNLGSVALEQRQGQPAMALLTEGLECAWGFGDKEVIGWCLEALAAAAAEGSAEKAATLLGAVEVLREDTGAAPQPDERRLHQRTLARLGAELDASSMARAWEEGRSMTLQEAVTYALTHSSVPRT